MPHLTQAELETQLSLRLGLIPTAMDESCTKVVWSDLGSYHCYEGFFHQSLAVCSGLSRSGLDHFTSNFSVTRFLKIPEPHLPPSGFVFHAGRCGSTLLAKVLSSSRSNLVFSEASPHNRVWCALKNSIGASIDDYRALLCAMGRRRLLSYSSHVVKFTSFNIVQFLDDIRAASFPGVPAIFLFREPNGVLDSYKQEPPRWIGRNIGIGKTWDLAETALTDFFQAALSIRDSQFRCMDYASLTPRVLPSVLEFLHVTATKREVGRMAAEFSWDAKGGIMPRAFVPSPRGQKVASDRLRDLHRQLIARSVEDW